MSTIPRLSFNVWCQVLRGLPCLCFLSSSSCRAAFLGYHCFGKWRIWPARHIQCSITIICNFLEPLCRKISSLVVTWSPQVTPRILHRQCRWNPLSFCAVHAVITLVSQHYKIIIHVCQSAHFFLQTMICKAILGAQRIVHVMLLLHKLHRMPICFQVQFKVLLWPLNSTWHMIWLPVEPSSLHQPVLPFRQEGYAVDHVTSFQLLGSRMRAFSIYHWPCCLEHSLSSPEVRQVLTLVAFQKCLKICLCYLAWG